MTRDSARRRQRTDVSRSEPGGRLVIRLGVMVLVERAALLDVGRVQIYEDRRIELERDAAQEVLRVAVRHMNAVTVPRYLANLPDQVRAIEPRIHLPRAILLATTDEATP